MSPAIVAIILGLLFVAVAIAFFWQEAAGAEDTPEYIVTDVVAYVSERIPDLDEAHIRRIVEAEVYYLQGLVDDPEGFRPIAGSPAAIDFVEEQALAAGFKYDRELIEVVMALEAEYLMSIGVVGTPVGRDDVT
ncbi:MAG: hypothetical protein HKN07_10970 [Acidimicrobiia bacterium]|nr:hypothetical protein [Acidimicrobiia bacterium]NNF64766.1 hypothetical protein [Acidimicrobiia bacterium]